MPGEAGELRYLAGDLRVCWRWPAHRPAACLLQLATYIEEQRLLLWSHQTDIDLVVAVIYVMATLFSLLAVCLRLLAMAGVAQPLRPQAVTAWAAAGISVVTTTLLLPEDFAAYKVVKRLVAAERLAEAQRSAAGSSA